MTVGLILIFALGQSYKAFASDHADLVKACLLKRSVVSADQDEAGDMNIAASYNRYCEAEAAKLSAGNAPSEDISSPEVVGQIATPATGQGRARPAIRAPSNDGPKATAASDKAAQTPVKKAAASAQNTQPQSANQASPDASSDIQTCRDALSNVRSCCTNPASCLTNYSNASAQDGGLTDYCKQMTAAGNNSKNINDAAAAVCSDRKSSCQGACDKLIQKYQTLSGSCSGCDSQNIYDDALASLQSVRGQCGQYDAVTDALVAQGLGGNRSQQAGDACSSAGSSSPSSGAGGKDDKSKMESASLNGSAACEANPSAPGCAEAAASQAAKPTDSLAQLSAARSAQTDFNSGDTGGASAGPASMGASGSGANGPSVKPIANNTGGGIPGSGSGQSGSILGGNGGGGLFGGNAKSGIGDVDRGLRSGGYSTAPGEDEKPDASNGFSGYGGSRDPASAPGGLDLKAYLPGGRLAADTLRAAAMQWQALGIHPSHIDLWTRISEKIQQKCHQGELLDCN